MFVLNGGCGRHACLAHMHLVVSATTAAVPTIPLLLVCPTPVCSPPPHVVACPTFYPCTNRGPVHV